MPFAGGHQCSANSMQVPKFKPTLPKKSGGGGPKCFFLAFAIVKIVE